MMLHLLLLLLMGDERGGGACFGKEFPPPKKTRTEGTNKIQEFNLTPQKMQCKKMQKKY